MKRARLVSAGGRTPWPLLAALTVGACGCNSTGVTATKVERALAATFANLVQTQGVTLGVAPVDVPSVRATASCHRVGPGTEARGPGDWLCSIQWSPPGYRGTWRDSYDLSVSSDGCYTATADGEEGHLGGPRLTRRDGSTVTNLLYAFDGCFDPT
jgi:ABC-2 type transport system permease protein